jgi:hypothetical protein
LAITRGWRHKKLEIDPEPLLVAFIPEADGTLDDHLEAWFLSEPKPIQQQPEGFESVINLGLGQQWLAPPLAAGRLGDLKELAAGDIR